MKKEQRTRILHTCGKLKEKDKKKAVKWRLAKRKENLIANNKKSWSAIL